MNKQYTFPEAKKGERPIGASVEQPSITESTEGHILTFMYNLFNEHGDLTDLKVIDNKFSFRTKGSKGTICTQNTTITGRNSFGFMDKIKVLRKIRIGI